MSASLAALVLAFLLVAVVGVGIVVVRWMLAETRRFERWNARNEMIEAIAVQWADAQPEVPWVHCRQPSDEDADELPEQEVTIIEIAITNPSDPDSFLQQEFRYEWSRRLLPALERHLDILKRSAENALEPEEDLLEVVMRFEKRDRERLSLWERLEASTNREAVSSDDEVES